MKKRILLAIFLSLSVWLVTAGIAYGANVFTRSLNASVKVLPRGDFSFFSDLSATQPITGINLPDVTPGGTSTFTVYVKNTSTADEVLTPGTIDVPSTIGTLSLTFDGQTQKTLPANAVSTLVGTLKASTTAVAGVVNFTFAVNAAPSVNTSTTTATTANNTTTTTPTVANVSYASAVQSVFNRFCISCHGSAGGVTLSSYSATINTGGVIPGNAAGSRLYQSVNSGSMSGYGMSAAQKQALADWINQGAPNN